MATRRHLSKIAAVNFLITYFVTFGSLYFVIVALPGTQEDRDPWPPHVPRAAQRVEGPDRSVYVLIRRSPANPTGPYRACIFDENVPWLYYRGTFTLARGGPYSPDHDALKAWCDNRLYFGETGLLEPTTAFTPRGYDHWETVCDLPESLVDR